MNYVKRDSPPETTGDEFFRYFGIIEQSLDIFWSLFAKLEIKTLQFTDFQSYFPNKQAKTSRSSSLFRNLVHNVVVVASRNVCNFHDCHIVIHELALAVGDDPINLMRRFDVAAMVEVAHDFINDRL